MPSRWYSFSFNLKPDWDHRYSYGPEIQAYMEETAEKFGVTEAVRFDTRVTRVDYEGPHWRLVTDGGEEHVFDVVISATGVLHHPAFPDIEGLEDFAGARFHTAQWDHSVDLAGKRVGIIGTGSTAAQVVGAITDQVGEMHVFDCGVHHMVPARESKETRYSIGITIHSCWVGAQPASQRDAIRSRARSLASRRARISPVTPSAADSTARRT